MKKYLLLLFSICLIVSCSDDEQNILNSKSKKLPIAIKTEKNGGYELTYDSHNRLTKVVGGLIYPEEHGLNYTDVYEIVYDNANKVSQLSSHDSQYPDNDVISTFVYTNNGITVHWTYNGGILSYGIKLNSQNRISKIIDLDDGTEIQSPFTYDEKGRLVKETVLDERGIYETYEYEYDDSWGVASNDKTPPWILELMGNSTNLLLHKVNNVNKITYVNFQNPQDSEITKLIYTMGKDGVPLSFHYKGGSYYNWEYSFIYR